MEKVAPVSPELKDLSEEMRKMQQGKIPPDYDRAELAEREACNALTQMGASRAQPLGAANVASSFLLMCFNTAQIAASIMLDLNQSRKG